MALPTVTPPAATGAAMIVSLEQRIRALEKRLLARQPSTGQTPWASEAPEVQMLLKPPPAAPASQEENAEEAKVNLTAGSLYQRVATLEERLADQVTHRQAFKDLLEKYNACRPFLMLGDTLSKAASTDNAAAAAADSEATTTATTSEQLAHSLLEDETVAYERQALALDAKAQLLVDIAPEWMRTLDLLKEAKEAQSALNPTEFQEVQTLVPKLEAVITENERCHQKMQQTQTQLDNLLAKYNDTIQVLSELFIHWDKVLEDLEKRVHTAERRRRI